MRLCNTDSQINCFTFSHLYVVVQLVWIAAFLVSTKFEHFRCQPPGKISYCCFGAPVLCTGALFCTLFLIRNRLRPYRCRSPPSDFDFCHQLKHRNWRKLLWRKSIFGIITRIIHRTWSLRCRMKLLCCFGNGSAYFRRSKIYRYLCNWQEKGKRDWQPTYTVKGWKWVVQNPEPSSGYCKCGSIWESQCFN